MTHARRTVFAGVFILTSLLAHASFAEQPLMGEPESYVKNASVKLWRGIVNTATGVGEIVRQPIVCTMEDGCSGVPVGIISGICMSFVRVGAGVLEIATFPWALDQEKGFDSLMNPDYVWQRAN